MRVERAVMALVRHLLIPCSLSLVPPMPASAADMVMEERPVSGFQAVVLMTAGDLQVTQGDRESLIVEAESTVMPKIATVVRNGVLHIEGKGTPIVTRLPIRLSLKVRELRALRAVATGAVQLNGIRGQTLTIDASGSSSIDGARLDLGELRLAISGSGDIRLDGKTNRQEVRISGAGTYNAKQMASQHAKISLSGAGNASVDVSRTLDVEISGSGEVRYTGDPVLKHRIAGSGSLRRASD